ncbi:MAG: hypothetical protein ACW981_02180 [Candidatus Hodarchaeales archaeon]|jgi:hypothetical protein
MNDLKGFPYKKTNNLLRKLKTSFSDRTKTSSSFKVKQRRGSPFVEEAGLILIALFFFVILFSVFGEIIDTFISIINEIINEISF